MAFLRLHRSVLTRQGAVQRFFRRRGAARCGPYFRIVFRECSGQRVYYLGKDTGLVERARTELEALQRPGKTEREQRRCAHRNRRLLRDMRRRLAALLVERGLNLKGWELRGSRRAQLLTCLEDLDLDRDR